MKVFQNLSGLTLAPLYRAADLLILPSLGEGYPLVVQEAMACGTPALVSTEIADGYLPAKPHLFTANPLDADEWVSLCRRILDDRRSLHEMADSLAQFARAHWSWASCVARYEEMISKASA